MSNVEWTSKCPSTTVTQLMLSSPITQPKHFPNVLKTSYVFHSEALLITRNYGGRNWEDFRKICDTFRHPLSRRRLHVLYTRASERSLRNCQSVSLHRKPSVNKRVRFRCKNLFPPRALWIFNFGNWTEILRCFQIKQSFEMLRFARKFAVLSRSSTSDIVILAAWGSYKASNIASVSFHYLWNNFIFSSPLPLHFYPRSLPFCRCRHPSLPWRFSSLPRDWKTIPTCRNSILEKKIFFPFPSQFSFLPLLLLFSVVMPAVKIIRLSLNKFSYFDRETENVERGGVLSRN